MEGVKTVYVPTFRNQTLVPRIEVLISDTVIRQIQEDGTYKLNTHNEGDIILTGVITLYDRVPLSFQPTDVITAENYEVSMTAVVTARERSTGKLIFEKTVKGRTSTQVGADLTSAEQAVMPLLTDDVAKKAVALLVDGNW